jgi:hypothetical protein
MARHMSTTLPILWATSSSASISAPIIYQDAATWLPSVTAFLQSRLKKNPIAKWRGLDLSAFYDDDPEWLALLDSELRGALEETESEFAEWLTAMTVRLVHGCRALSLGSYLAIGIRPYDTSALRKVLDGYLGNRQIAPYRDAILETVAELAGRANGFNVFLALDERDMLRTAGHYLIYGSEWLTAALGKDCRGILKRTGVPTLVYVNLPLKKASRSERLQLSHRLLREWVRLSSRPTALPSFADFTFVVGGGVDADLIGGHRHPRAIVDPFEGFRMYRNRRSSCDACRKRFSSCIIA